VRGRQRYNNITKYKCTVSTILKCVLLKWFPFLMKMSLGWEIQQWNIRGCCGHPSFKGIPSPFGSHPKTFPEQSQQCNVIKIVSLAMKNECLKDSWTLDNTYNVGSVPHKLTKTCQKQVTTVGPFHPVVQHYTERFSRKLHKKRNMV